MACKVSLNGYEMFNGTVARSIFSLSTLSFILVTMDAENCFIFRGHKPKKTGRLG